MHDGPNFTLDRIGKLIFSEFKIVSRLKIQPESRAGIEITRQAQRGIRSHATAFMNNFGDAGNRNAQIQIEFVHAEAERHEKILAQNLTGVNRGQSLLFFADFLT